MGIVFNSTLSGISSSSTFHSFSICLPVDADCAPLDLQKVLFKATSGRYGSKSDKSRKPFGFYLCGDQQRPSAPQKGMAAP